jgi:hypothetical protein
VFTRRFCAIGCCFFQYVLLERVLKIALIKRVPETTTYSWITTLPWNSPDFDDYINSLPDIKEKWNNGIHDAEKIAEKLALDKDVLDKSHISH